MAETKTAFHSNLLVSSSPHYVTKLDTRRTMQYVCIALLPPCVMAVFYFGLNALIRIILGPVFCFACEYVYDRLLKKKDTTKDCSCFVTGIILALNLPATLPIWQEFIGCLVAIVIVKCLYGGIGKNIANPAIVGRIVLFLSFSSNMSTWPLTRLQKAGVDSVTGATALGELADGADTLPSLLSLFIGNVGGAMGETCAIAILIGAAFLIWKKIISPIIPCVYVATVFIFALIYYAVVGGAGQYGPLGMAVFHVLAGGLLFGAVFCATDYVTSPIMNSGKVIYAIGLGICTMVIRLFGSYPEGVSFAILFMNILTPLIDRYTERQFYGIAKKEKEAKKAAKSGSSDDKKEGGKA